MLYDPKLVKGLALVLPAVAAAAAQSGPVALQSAGGQLAYRVAFRGKPVIEWSNLGLLLDGRGRPARMRPGRRCKARPIP
jgi:hypothetical protein